MATTTVIIGAGSIGLSTAYHLALASLAASSPRKIVVLETLPTPFGATSGSCTGCFHYEFREQNGGHLTELGKYSFDIWEHLAKDEVFQSKVGYRDHCFLEMELGKGPGLEEVPDWFQADPSWHVNEEVLRSPSALV
jgi:glycine/D-amino acid oxidase-like deaminating enzyme